MLKLRRPCGWSGTPRLLGAPWSFQGQGCGGLQEAGDFQARDCHGDRHRQTSSWQHDKKRISWYDIVMMSCTSLSTDDSWSQVFRRRETEIKHGRVAMFATIGIRLSTCLPCYMLFPDVTSVGWPVLTCVDLLSFWPWANWIWRIWGYIVPEYYKFDGYLSPSMNLKFADVPNGLKAPCYFSWCRGNDV